MRQIPLALGLLLGGCMLGNAGSTKRLSDAVNQMDRSTRWGQLADAAQLVEPTYRTQFITNHRGWGQVIQVADSEVLHVELTPDSESAVALVSYDWYLPDAMSLHQTVVRQRWSRLGSNYALASEAIVQGDGRLLGGKTAAVPARSPELDALGVAD
jgi:hypothetical protein